MRWIQKANSSRLLWKYTNFCKSFKKRIPLKIWLLNLTYLEVACMEEKWRKIYDIYKFSSLHITRNIKSKMSVYEKVNQVLLTLYISIRRNYVPGNRPILLEVLQNLLTHLATTLSTIKGWLRGWKETCVPFYRFLHLRIHNKKSSLHSEEYCQWLISKALQKNDLLNNKSHFFRSTIIAMKNKVKT